MSKKSVPYAAYEKRGQMIELLEGDVERLKDEVDGAWHDHGIMVEQYKYWSAEARRLRAALESIVHPKDGEGYSEDLRRVASEALKDECRHGETGDCYACAASDQASEALKDD